MVRKIGRMGFWTTVCDRNEKTAVDYWCLIVNGKPIVETGRKVFSEARAKIFIADLFPHAVDRVYRDTWPVRWNKVLGEPFVKPRPPAYYSSSEIGGQNGKEGEGSKKGRGAGKRSA